MGSSLPPVSFRRVNARSGALRALTGGLLRVMTTTLPHLEGPTMSVSSRAVEGFPNLREQRYLDPNRGSFVAFQHFQQHRQGEAVDRM